VIAALEGIKMAEMAGMTNVVLETDALLLKHALANDSFRLFPVGVVSYTRLKQQRSHALAPSRVVTVIELVIR
jgi:hypothetical protein